MYAINYLSRSFMATKTVGDRKHKVTASAIQHQGTNVFKVDMIRIESYATVDNVETLISTSTTNATAQNNINFNVALPSAEKVVYMTECDDVVAEATNYLVNGIDLVKA